MPRTQLSYYYLDQISGFCYNYWILFPFFYNQGNFTAFPVMEEARAVVEAKYIYYFR